MVEPHTSAGISLTGLAIVLLGPQAGPFVTIVLTALAGSLWPLTAMENATRTAGVILMTRCVLTSVALTGSVAIGFGAYYSLPPTEYLAPISFVISALGNGLRPVLDAVTKSLASLVGKKSEEK